MNSSKSVKERNSAIESLKILAILLIITTHTIHSLAAEGSLFSYLGGYAGDLSTATTNFQYLLLSVIKHISSAANVIFFICSAWFLLESDSASKKRILIMILDIWMVSVIIMLIVCICRKGLNPGSILRSLFPTAFSNNWYLTCYLMFYAIHPLLNRLISSMSRKELFRVCLVSSVMYFGIAFATRLTDQLFGFGASYYSSYLVIWIVLYFVMAYIKSYAPDLSENRSINTALFLVGLAGNLLLFFLTDLAGLKFSRLSGSLQMWNQPYNPFMIVSVIGLFNLARNVWFESRVINYIAKMSLFIYIIHENFLLRTICRPAMWRYVFTNFGYSNVIGWLLVLSFAVFCFSLLGSILYTEIIHKVVVRFCDWIYPKLSSLMRKIEKKAGIQ